VFYAMSECFNASLPHFVSGANKKDRGRIMEVAMSVQKLEHAGLLFSSNLSTRDRNLIDQLELSDGEIAALVAIAEKLDKKKLTLGEISRRTGVMRL
jgi:hypothetical protein